MTALLDVNVLVALAWPNHVHHDAARLWFKESRSSGWATCVLTEAGFVRVSCNPSAVQRAVTPHDAIALLRRMKALESHSFWPMARSVPELDPEIVEQLQGYRQLTDAVLLSLAMQHGGQLATLDGRLVHATPGRLRRSIRLIPI